jgi:predicted membrane protein
VWNMCGAPENSIRYRVLTMHGKKANMLWTILVVLVILWLLGFSLHVGGGLIHLLLVVALIVLVVNLVTGRRGTV